MKIEKVNENQIRCTLTKEDLEDRELKISELAYGSEKAKSLFRDMMQQASFQFGFEAENIPLMIEAIPLNSDCIVLIITKVEDPDELDTRFSKFSPLLNDDNTESTEDDNEEILEHTDEFLDLIKKLREGRTKKEKDTADETDSVDETETEALRNGNTVTEEEPKQSKAAGRISPTILYSFRTFREVIRIADILSGKYHGISSLYKDSKDGSYLLFLDFKGLSNRETANTIHVLSEYGKKVNSPALAARAFYEEHGGAIIKDHALQALAKIDE